jgi:hypothetical protein
MATLFELVVRKMIEWGFYGYLFPFLLTLALFYGLLSKSKLLGGSPLVNGVIALCAAFLIFGFPILAGISLALPLSMFFAHTTVFLLVFVMAFLLASLFYPDMMDWLASVFTRRTTLWAMLGLGMVLFISSGLMSVLTQQIYAPPTPGVPALPTDIIILIVGVVLFVVFLMIAVSVTKAE